MGGPGSGKRAASRGGSRRGSRGGSRGGSQVRGRCGATASSIQDQLLYEEEEEQRIIDSTEGQENDSDENEMSGEEEVGPDKEDQAIEVYAQCVYCKDEKYHNGSSDSFSNFLRHLRRVHEKEYEQMKAGGKSHSSDQSSMKNFLASNIPKDRQKKIDNLIAEMIVLDNLPLTILQREGFRKLISFIAPIYKIPSYEKMRDTVIPSMYSRIVEGVKEILNSCDVATIMLDLWSSNSMLGFMGVSFSSVTADYIPFTCFLNMKEMPKNHTAEAILSESECVFSDWGLNGKVIRTVTDNASNMTKAFKMQLSNFIREEKEDEFIELELKTAGKSTKRDLSHQLHPTQDVCLKQLATDNRYKQLVIKDAMKALDKFVSEALDLLCKIVGGVRRSVVDTKVLLDSVGFKIPMMNLTRWNSQFSMVKYFLNAIDIDPTLQSKLNACKTHGSLSSLQLKLNQCSLDPRVNLESKFITSCKSFVEELSRSLKKRMGWILRDTLFVLGSVLDPRIKGSWITTAGEEVEEVLSSVKELLKLRYRTVGGNEGDHIENNADSGAEDDGNRRRKADENPVGHPVQKRSRPTSRPLLASVLVRPRTLSKGVAKVLDEFDVYFKEPPIVNEKGKFDLDFSPCDYWKVNQHRFPALAPIARDVMGIPVSSANIERAFSTAVDILSAMRNKIKPKLFDMLVFIKRNAHLLKTVCAKEKKDK
uniref:HAT C-terminal dimerisation domain-containing protein n=1 Tax=Daphnia galeata TaxID=27404 RepID=A0A8J2RT72_9CRUS|nr:unnamed protein product [Daphnia galeata]